MIISENHGLDTTPWLKWWVIDIATQDRWVPFSHTTYPECPSIAITPCRAELQHGPNEEVQRLHGALASTNRKRPVSSNTHSIANRLPPGPRDCKRRVKNHKIRSAQYTWSDSKYASSRHHNDHQQRVCLTAKQAVSRRRHAIDSSFVLR